MQFTCYVLSWMGFLYVFWVAWKVGLRLRCLVASLPGGFVPGSGVWKLPISGLGASVPVGFGAWEWRVNTANFWLGGFGASWLRCLLAPGPRGGPSCTCFGWHGRWVHGRSLLVLGGAIPGPRVLDALIDVPAGARASWARVLGGMQGGCYGRCFISLFVGPRNRNCRVSQVVGVSVRLGEGTWRKDINKYTLLPRTRCCNNSPVPPPPSPPPLTAVPQGAGGRRAQRGHARHSQGHQCRILCGLEHAHCVFLGRWGVMEEFVRTGGSLPVRPHLKM